MITLTRTSSIMSWLEKALVFFGGNGYMVASLRPIFSINIEGSLKGFFPTSRELRQEDPFSPFLFTLVADSFSQIFGKAESNACFQVGAEKVNVSHLQFADDTLTFIDGDPKIGHILKSLIPCFELVSRLKVNWSKSHILTAS